MEDGPEGAVVARIATLGVVDRDGDLTVPGAFGAVEDVKVSPFNHSSAYGAALPVGVGKVFERGGAAFFEGLLFRDTIGGRELHTTLKRLSEAGAPCEWSYGFEVVESEDAVRGDQKVRVLKRLALFEVSPVLRGAGIGTRTVSVKSDEGRYSPLPQPSPIKGEGVAERDFADLQVIEARMASRDVLASLNTEV